MQYVCKRQLRNDFQRRAPVASFRRGGRGFIACDTIPLALCDNVGISWISLAVNLLPNNPRIGLGDAFDRYVSRRFDDVLLP